MRFLFNFLFFLTLISTSIHAKKVALLVETASGYPIYSELDIITIKKLLGSAYDITILNESQATSTNIRAFLQKMSRLKPNDTFLFYYSGHGARFKKDKGSKESDKEDDFLVTSDIRCDHNVIDNVLIDNELNHLYANISARKVIIIDACHSSTMYKAIGIEDDKIFSKLYKGDTSSCSPKIPFSKGFSIPRYSPVKLTNIIHLGAADEKESSEGSDEGGIFTLALEKSLKERGDVTFMKLLPTVRKNIKPIATRLGTTGAFRPSFHVNGLSWLRTKDIFVLPKPRGAKNSLKAYLDDNVGAINLKIQEGKKFSVDTRITLKAKVAKSNKHYYLIDMLDKNSYRLLTSSRVDQCILFQNKRQCQFGDLRTSPPFGETNIYMIITSKPLNSKLSQTDTLLKNGDALQRALEQMSIEVGRVSFEVYQ